MCHSPPHFDNQHCMHPDILPRNPRSQTDSSRMGALSSHFLLSRLHFAWTESERNNLDFTCSRTHASTPIGQSLLGSQIGQNHLFHFLPIWITGT